MQTFYAIDYGLIVNDMSPTAASTNLAALDACFADAVLAAVNVGSKIVLPSGRICLSDDWNVYRINSPRRDIVIQGEGQMVTKLVAGYYGANKALVKSRPSSGDDRSSPLSIIDIGFENLAFDGINPMFIDIHGHGESRLRGLRFAKSNNTHMRSISAQNVRMTDIVSFYGGHNFPYKNTDSRSFSVISTGHIESDAAIFTTADEGKPFFILPSDETRRAKYTLGTYVNSTKMTIVETPQVESGASGFFSPAQGSISSGSNIYTADCNCFVSDHDGMTVYIRGASQGAYGQGLLRASIVEIIAPNKVRLSKNATRTTSNGYIGVPAIDMGIADGYAGSSDVKIDELHIEHYQGVGFIGQNTDSYRIIQSKIHGETAPSFDLKRMSIAAMWLDDFGGRFDIELDSSCSFSDCQVHVSNQNDLIVFNDLQTRGIKNGQVFRAEQFSGQDGYIQVNGVNSYQIYADPYDMVYDANYITDVSDPRILFNGLVNMVGDSGKPAFYFGRGITCSISGFFSVDKISLKDGTTQPSTIAGKASIWVSDANGDMKVKFGDGVVQTITAD